MVPVAVPEARPAMRRPAANAQMLVTDAWITPPTNMKTQLPMRAFLAAVLVTEVAAAKRTDHGTEDPRVHGERPLDLLVSREHEARVFSHGASIALVFVVVLREVGLRRRPTALERLQPRQERGRVQDRLGLDQTRSSLVGLVERRRRLGRRGLLVAVSHVCFTSLA
ncbi:hypothetical protein ON010_g7703 [Phytophthora cinnamomi]|nr:hypothetical protein ON010_g7703 [Phytophthora cinnamomi]